MLLDYINKNEWTKIIEMLPKIKLSSKINSNNYLIHYIGYENNIDAFKKIIKYDKNIKYKDSYGNTIGHIAALNDYTELLKLIIDHDITILNEKNNDQTTIPHLIYDKLDLIKYIFNKKNISKVDLNLYNSSTMTNLLILNILDKKMDIIKYLLKHKKIIDVSEPLPAPPLVLACDLGYVDIVELLLDNGADVNKVDKNGASPLQFAVAKKFYDICKILLKKGADYNYVNFYGENFIPFLAIKSSNEILDLIMDYDIDMNYTDKFLNTLGHLLFTIENNIPLNIKRKIIKKSIDLNAQNIDGDTIFGLILMHNSWNDYKDIIKDKKIDIMIENKKGIKIEELINENKNRDEIYNTINPISGNPENINLEEYPYSLFSLFRASTLNIAIYVHYILTKYKNICIPINNKLKIDIDKELIQLNEINKNLKYDYETAPELMSMVMMWHDRNNYKLPYNFSKSFNNTRNRKRFVMMFIYLVDESMQHANVVLYDRDNNTVERFDPYGYKKYNDYEELDNVIMKMFKNVKYIAPREYENINSFQTISNETYPLNRKIGDIGGFCVAWCFWYIEMRLNNLNVPPIKLVNKSTKKLINLKVSFNEYIRNYANMLTKYQDNILLDAGIDKHILYNKQFTLDDSKMVFKYIIQKIKKINV